MMILHFLGFSGRGLSLKLLVLNTRNGAERFYFVAMLYLDDDIPVNSATFANEETLV